jgi:hypothetical protein
MANGDGNRNGRIIVVLRTSSSEEQLSHTRLTKHSALVNPAAVLRVTVALVGSLSVTRVNVALSASSLSSFHGGLRSTVHQLSRNASERRILRTRSLLTRVTIRLRRQSPGCLKG